MANAPVDPAKVQERFDFRKGSLSTPETRSLAVVPVTAQQGPAIAERLRKGEDPSVVAKSIGKDALILTDRPKTALPDRKVADAAFAMKAGEVAGPVRFEDRALVLGGAGDLLGELVARLEVLLRGFLADRAVLAPAAGQRRPREVPAVGEDGLHEGLGTRDDE